MNKTNQEWEESLAYLVHAASYSGDIEEIQKARTTISQTLQTEKEKMKQEEDRRVEQILEEHFQEKEKRDKEWLENEKKWCEIVEKEKKKMKKELMEAIENNKSEILGKYIIDCDKLPDLINKIQTL